MKNLFSFKRTIPIVLALGVVLGVVAQENPEQTNIRSFFLVTRKKPSKPTAKAAPPSKPETPIGLGYSLYQCGDGESMMHVDSGKQFHRGDKVRFVLEPNTDGYLYVFVAENGINPLMIFPDARASEGNNFIKAHVPNEIPSRYEPDPRFRWFTFGKPAVDRVYLVVSRTPLPNVPTGDRLKQFHTVNKAPWKPTEVVWRQIESETNIPLRVSRRPASEGKPISTEEDGIIAKREFGFPPEAPEPAVVLMTASTKSRILAASVDLVHDKD